MNSVYDKLRGILSKVKFKMRLNPTIIKNKNYKNFIPEPYKGVVILYADFELAWAWRYSKDYINNKDEIKKTAIRERENIPEIIRLCEKFRTPVTWATVGHLFLDKCKKEEGAAHRDIPRNKYFENEYWIYDNGDWFDDDPCGNYINNPEWYCPDLIEDIIKSNVKHEIGCHTFSHIDCRDEICPPEVFISEINECIKLADGKNIKMKSFVHPGHTIGNLNLLFNLGFSSFRTDYGNILGYPEKHSSGLWELKGTMELTYRKRWSINFNKKFYREIIKQTVRNNSVCVFWFHPSFDKVFLSDIFPDILSDLDFNKDKLWITTAGEYIDRLNKRII